MTNKRYVSQVEIEAAVANIANQLFDWKPDLIIGIANGGYVPARMLSELINVPFQMITVQLRDPAGVRQIPILPLNSKILLVDDINDTGATLKWAWNNWGMDMRWGDDIKTAVLYDNIPSLIRVDYFAEEIDKSVEDVWIVFPWEV